MNFGVWDRLMVCVVLAGAVHCVAQAPSTDKANAATAGQVAASQAAAAGVDPSAVPGYSTPIPVSPAPAADSTVNDQSAAPAEQNVPAVDQAAPDPKMTAASRAAAAAEQQGLPASGMVAVPAAAPEQSSAPVTTGTQSPVQVQAASPVATAPVPAVVESAPMSASAERQRLPVDNYYVLEPGDTVTVTFRFTPEFNDEVVIGPDGRASLKSAGDLMLAGLTLPEAQRLIERESAAKLVNPDVTLSLKDFQRPQFVVAGEVQNPGHFELRRATTVLQAILLAGGPKEDGAMSHVILFRKLNSEYAEVHVLQLSKYDAKVRAKNDLLLQPDDMILVRHDLISKIDRIVKLANLGVYLNPIGNNGLF